MFCKVKVKVHMDSRDVHMIIEGQGLKVRKVQYVLAQHAPNFFSGLNRCYDDHYY